MIMGVVMIMGVGIGGMAVAVILVEGISRNEKRSDWLTSESSQECFHCFGMMVLLFFPLLSYPFFTLS